MRASSAPRRLNPLPAHGERLTGQEAHGDGVERSPLVLGMAAVFAGFTVLLVVLALAFRELLVFVVAVPFAVSTYVFWYHATGRLADRVRRERGRAAGGGADAGRGGFGAGPRENWEPRGDGRARFGPGGRFGPGRGPRGRQRAGGQRRAPGADPGPTDAEAYRTLDVEQGADEATVRRAYRERVKEVHPDRGGDEEEFKRVTDAYEQLTG